MRHPERDEAAMSDGEQAVLAAVREIEQEATQKGILQPGAAFALGALGLAVGVGPGWSADDLAHALVSASAPPATLPARLREATAAVERVRDDMTTHPGSYRPVIDALTLLGRWLAADPEDPAAQAVARALAIPTTDAPGGDR